MSVISHALISLHSNVTIFGKSHACTNCVYQPPFSPHALRTRLARTLQSSPLCLEEDLWRNQFHTTKDSEKATCLIYNSIHICSRNRFKWCNDWNPYKIWNQQQNGSI